MQEHNRQCKRIGMSNIGIRHIESTFFGVRIDDMTIWKAQLQTQYTVYTDSGQLQQRSGVAESHEAPATDVIGKTACKRPIMAFCGSGISHIL